MNPHIIKKISIKSKEVLFRGLVRTQCREQLAHLGSIYGGFWVPIEELTKVGDAVAYSAGVGEDVSFDEALTERFDIDVWCFDPTPRSIDYMSGRTSAELHFEPIGLWSSEADLKFYAPEDPSHVSHSAHNLQGTTDFFIAHCENLSTIMRRHGHTNLRLLKMNIEGAEAEVIPTLAEYNIRPRVLIIAFEAKTTRMNLRQVRCVKALGYRAIKTSGHTVTFIAN